VSLKRFPKTWQEKFEDELISGEYVLTKLDSSILKEAIYKAKYYLKHGKYPKRKGGSK